MKKIEKFDIFTPLFKKLDKELAKKGRVVLAIDGHSASGKSTLADYLKELYNCTVFKMDDFFLQPHQRTPERLAEIGGNVDRERFEKEVLVPLSKNDEVNYRRYDCSISKLMWTEKIIPANLVVIEGVYCMHPELCGYYDLSVFLDISEDTQKERILERNSTEMAKRFFDEWIPLENRYFEYMNVKERCDVVVAVD